MSASSRGVRIALWVASVGGALAYLLLLPGGAIDGQVELAEIFANPVGTGTQPLEVREARELLDGTRVVSCSAPRGERAALDVFLLRYRGPEPVLRQLAGAGDGLDDEESQGSEDEELARWQEDPTFDLRRRLRAGGLEWAGQQASYVLERHYEKSGIWRDEARVNLSSEDAGRKAYALLVVRWPAAESGAREELSGLLSELAPRSTLEDG